VVVPGKYIDLASSGVERVLPLGARHGAGSGVEVARFFCRL